LFFHSLPNNEFAAEFLDRDQLLSEGIMKPTLLAATLLLSALMAWHGRSSAQSPGAVPENLDSLITTDYQTNSLPGMIAAIIKDNKIAWMRPYGWADIPNRIPWRPQSIHRVASISKTMMQAAFMQLVEKHLVSLDDSINRFLPFRVVNPWYPGVPITVRMVMTHTSTIYDDYTNVLNPNLRVGDNPMTYKTLLEIYPLRYLNRRPGTRYNYTNTGSCLLAYMTDRITGRPFEAYMRDSIFTPLGLDPIGYFLREIDTSFLAHPYDLVFHDYGFLSYPTTPAGGVRTTLPSIAKWLLTHMNGGVWNNVRIMHDSTVSQMMTPLFLGDGVDGMDSSGLIWYSTSFGAYPNKIWGHAGGTHGYVSFMGFDPIKKTGIISFINGSDGNGTLNKTWWMSLHEKLLQVADTLRPTPLSTPSRIGFRQRIVRDTSFVYTCSNLFGPVTVTSLSLPPGESYFSLIEVPSLPVTLNTVGDSLAFRIVYAGPDRLIHKSYVEIKTTDVATPVQKVPIYKDFPRSSAGPVVCAGDTAVGVPQWGRTVDYRLKVANIGSSIMAPAIGGTIRSLDTAATIVSGNPFVVGDILPGEVRFSTKLAIAFSRWCTGERDISFELAFLSNDIEYWRDTMTIRVVNPEGIDRDGQELPSAFALDQNYPNPFNPTTVISYRLPVAGNVKLSVYDMLGCEVAVLVNETKMPGSHEVKFDAIGLSSGVYFYRLRAGDFTETKRFVLLR
jgi:CubicO group peptidase (beta-lactamase class C family)